VNQPAESTQQMMREGQNSTDDTHLRGSWLILARLVWIVLVMLYLSSFLASLPVYFALLQKPCQASSCASGQLNVATLHWLSALGLSTSEYALFFILLNVIVALVCVALGLLLLTRKSHDWMALLVAFWFVAVLGTANITTDWTTMHQALGPVLGPIFFSCIIFLDTIATFLVFALLPTGRFIPRWIRWCVVIGGVLTLVLLVIPLSAATWLMLMNALLLGVMSIILIAQIYRYRSVSSTVQRQQTKWVVFGLLVCLFLALALFVPELIETGLSQPGSFYQAIISASWYVFSLLIALAFAIALLRYRLYDIDVLINRALVYGTLTVILTAVYIGVILALQYLLRELINQTSSVAIVISTLLIATMFQPLRRRIQNIIDRRFYRRKYDAVKTLEAFSATLRNELDLNQLREQLLTVVQDTMQPSHVSLWLREPDRKPPHPDRRQP
jgi:hypothetical protein